MNFTNIIRPQRPKRKISHHEDDLQKGCVDAFRLMWPRRWIFAIPNGGKRNRMEGERLKAQGVTAGVSDLFVPEPYFVMREAMPLHSVRPVLYCGLWIELKFGKNKPTVEQVKFLDDMVLRGYATAVCYSIDQFINACTNYFSGEVVLWKAS